MSGRKRRRNRSGGNSVSVFLYPCLVFMIHSAQGEYSVRGLRGLASGFGNEVGEDWGRMCGLVVLELYFVLEVSSRKYSVVGVSGKALATFNRNFEISFLKSSE